MSQSYILEGYKADRKFLSISDLMTLISNKSPEPGKYVYIKVHVNRVDFIYVPEDIGSECVVRFIDGVYKDKSQLIAAHDINTLVAGSFVCCRLFVTKHGDKYMLTRVLDDAKDYAYVEAFDIIQ